MDEQVIDGKWPALGLQVLTWEQIQQIDEHLERICQGGHGSLVIEVKRGKPRFIRPAPSICG